MARARGGSVIGMKVTPDDREIIERRAAVLGMTTSDYLRFAVSFEAVTGGDLGAIRLLAGRAREKLVRWLQRISDTGPVVEGSHGS